MRMHPLQLWLTPLILFTGGLLSGYLINKFVLRLFRTVVVKTVWQGDDILAEAIAGFPLLWCCMAGMYGAVITSPISPEQIEVAQKILLVLVIVSVTIVFARIATGIAGYYRRKHEGIFPSATILSNLTKI